MGSLDVVAVGELNPDLILDGLTHQPRMGREILADRCTFTLGSSTALCAANLAALDLRVGIVGKVGADPFGDFVLEALRARRIDASRVLRDPGVPTGVTVSLATPADRAMVTYPGAMATLTAGEVDLAYVTTARHLHVSSLFLQRGLQPGCGALFQAARAHGLTTSLDPAWDPDETWEGGIAALLPLLDVLFANEAEVCALGGDADWRRAGARLADRVRCCVVKRGGEGAAAFRGGEIREAPGFPVAAVDPTGAGDAFNAGFVLGMLSGWSPAECLRWGNACGAMTVSRPGGSGAFAGRSEVERFMQSATGAGDKERTGRHAG
jgi:sugar/nucleoside kinase (ribokinase family)